MPRIHEMVESKYLKKEDVGEDGTIVTVSDFERVNVAMDDQPPEHKWVMRLKEFDKPMVLNTTNMQLCEKIFGSDNTDDWLNKRVIVYSDPNIAFGGKLVGGIRVRKIQSSQGPRQINGNGNDFDEAPSAAQVTLAEQDMRDACLNGTDALKRAWSGLSEPLKDALRPKLAEFKTLAANPPPKATATVDTFDDDVPF